MPTNDFIKISAGNSYGDTLNASFQNPDCESVLHETIVALMLMGFSPATIYVKMEEQAELLKNEIFKK